MYIKKEKLKIVLKALKKGNPIYRACQMAGMDVITLWRWRKAIPKLDERIKQFYDSRIALVEDALYKAALEGNITAQIFFLKNRSPDRWRDNDFSFAPATHYHLTKMNDDDKIKEAAKRGLRLPDEIARRLNAGSSTKSA